MRRLSESYSGLLSSGNGNVIMIQEGGNVGSKSGTQFPFTFSRRHEFNACFFEQPYSKKQQCTTGMFVESGFTIKDQIFCYSGVGKRPIVTCECTYGTQEYVFATVHSTAAERLAEEELQIINLSFRNQYDCNGIPWIIMGDLNCQADEFVPDYPINISYSPGMTHQNGKTLDFAVYSDLLKGKINVRICSDLSGYVPASSDHFPIYCDF